MQEMLERIARQDQDQEVAQVIEVSYLYTGCYTHTHIMTFFLPFDADIG